MTCVTSLARFDEKTNQRLQRLIEDHKTSRQKGAKMWKEMMAIFEDGLQSFLSATAEEVESSSNVDVNRMKRNIKTFLRDWRQPALLFELFNIEQDDESARKLVLYVFHALLGNANLDDIRFNHPLNNQHLASLRQDVVDKWIQLSDASSSSSSSSSSSLLGTRDLEAMLMMGEDARTCMAIEPANKRTLKGLLGYLLQGNTRMLCVNPALPPSSSSSSSSHGIETRKETVLFVDRPYFEGEFDKQAAEDLKQQATQLADHLGVPLHLARDSPPSDQEIASLKLPPLSEAYPYPALEFVDKAGISPYVWRDGRYGVGLVFRGELGGANIRTSLGGTAVAVGILFEGWTDCLSVVERSKDSSRLGYMKDVQLIGAAIATDVRGTQTSQRQKKRMPWELTF
ncbi:hypothetical protein GUITHDRAFT_160396 [Guillardia theta CCMP2712]|uniref:Uncharacterized protein n=1 Tax=Guillardia theta (strain CCMP2712) TaxID=905079 RepID=L1K3J8_GUITC|nr:hypothetical protein GUITHDRAFT_160396 [Guillardia theta CCMP2712]EKX55179.1 hypothetical protein GUITHDRAFT_160396 [Guillardia theta CCMP2712]|eukprot:XP_005842159.1 hypothetical protein GUITHDRAFT_160396 [Guillardia theta CCMP2712]